MWNVPKPYLGYQLVYNHMEGEFWDCELMIFDFLVYPAGQTMKTSQTVWNKWFSFGPGWLSHHLRGFKNEWLIYCSFSMLLIPWSSWSSITSRLPFPFQPSTMDIGINGGPSNCVDRCFLVKLITQGLQLGFRSSNDNLPRLV